MDWPLHLDAIKDILFTKSKLEHFTADEQEYLKSIWFPTDSNFWVTMYKRFSPNLGEEEALQNIPNDFRTDLKYDIIIDEYPTFKESLSPMIPITQ